MATALSSTEIQVSWSEVPSIDQNGVITMYEVFYGGTFNGSVFTVGVSVNITGLEEFVVYNISVRAYTRVGSGPFSDTISEMTGGRGYNKY